MQKKNTEGKLFLDYLSFLIYSLNAKNPHILKFNKIIIYQFIHNHTEHFQFLYFFKHPDLHQLKNKLKIRLIGKFAFFPFI